MLIGYKRSIRVKLVAITVAVLMLWQDAAFCMPSAGETNALAASSHFFTPRAHIAQTDDGEWQVVFDDDEEFRNDALFYYIAILIGQYLKLGISEHTLTLDIQDVINAIRRHVGSDLLAEAEERDPLLAGCRIDDSYCGEGEGVYYLPDGRQLYLLSGDNY